MESQDLQLIIDRKCCPEGEIGWDSKQPGLAKVSLPMAKGLEQDDL